MKKMHTMPLNLGDFQRDIVGMDTREVGAYMLLLIAHTQFGKQGLPSDDKKLAQIARVSPKTWRNNLKKTILDKFKPHFDDETKPESYRLVNETCLEMIEQVEQRSAINSANALKRKDRGHANAQQRQSERNTIQRQKTKTNNIYEQNAQKDEATQAKFRQPEEAWKKALLQKHGRDIYVSWFQDLELTDNYVNCKTAFIMNKCKDLYGKDIIEAVGEEFKSFRVSS